MLLISSSYPIWTWSTFSMLTVAVLAAGLLYFRFLAPQLTETNYRGKNAKYNIRLWDRLVLFVLISSFLITFILVRPSFHFPIVAFTLLIFHRSLLNFAQGTSIIHELKLVEGQEIKCGQTKGVLQRLRWTGALVAEGDKLTFLPYSYLGKTALQVVQQDIPTSATIRCRWVEKEDRAAHTAIENVLFDYPYVIDGTKPVWKYAANSVDISLAISNSKYIDSLCEVLEQKEIQTEVLT